jgi:restriction system protein
MKIVLLLIALALSIVIIFGRPTVRKLRTYRHARNIRKASVILVKIRQFQEPHRRARIISYLRKVSPYVMEEMVLTAFESVGLRIRRSRRYSGDGGADGRVYRNNRSYLVQTKRYRGHIDVQDVRDFEQTIARENAVGGFFVHTGRTGRASWACINRSRIRILSGDRLLSLLLGERAEINEMLSIPGVPTQRGYDGTKTPPSVGIHGSTRTTPAWGNNNLPGYAGSRWVTPH